MINPIRRPQINIVALGNIMYHMVHGIWYIWKHMAYGTWYMAAHGSIWQQDFTQQQSNILLESLSFVKDFYKKKRPIKNLFFLNTL